MERFAPMLEGRWTASEADHYLDELEKSIENQAAATWRCMAESLASVSIDTIRSSYEETVRQSFLALKWAYEDLETIAQNPSFQKLPADAPERTLVVKAAGLLEVLLAGFGLDEETRKKMELGVVPVLVPLVVLGVAVSLSVAAIAWAIVAFQAASALSDWCQGFREEVQARKSAMEQGKTLPPGTPMVNVPPEAAAATGAGAMVGAVALLGAAALGFYLFLKK